MIVMEYVSTGMKVSDFEVEELYETLKAMSPEYEYNLMFSTANIFNRLRQGIAEEEIDHANVVFMFEGQALAINKYGMIVDWPKNFLALSADMAYKTMRAASNRRIAERKARKEQRDG